MLLLKFKLWKIKIGNETLIYNIWIKYRSIVSLHQNLGLCIKDKIRFRTSKSFFATCQLSEDPSSCTDMYIKFSGTRFSSWISVLHKLEFSLPETAGLFVVSTYGLEKKEILSLLIWWFVRRSLILGDPINIVGHLYM